MLIRAIPRWHFGHRGDFSAFWSEGTAGKGTEWSPWWHHSQ